MKNPMPHDLARQLEFIVAEECDCLNSGWDFKIAYENGVRKIVQREEVTPEQFARIKNRLQRVGA